MKTLKIIHTPTGKFSNKTHNLSIGDVGSTWCSVETAVRYLRRIEKRLVNNKGLFDFTVDGKEWKFSANDFQIVEYKIQATEIARHDLKDEWSLQAWEDAVSTNWWFRKMFSKLRRRNELSNFHYMVLIGHRIPGTTISKYVDFNRMNNWNQDVIQPMADLKIPKKALIGYNPVLAVRDRETMLLLKLVLGEFFVRVVDLKTCMPVDLHNI